MSGSIWHVLSAAAGALVALLLAPTGQAPRAAVPVEPGVELQRLHAEWQAEMARNQDLFGQR